MDKNILDFDKQMKFIRFIVGKFILFADFITRPRPMLREKTEQDQVDKITSKMSLYQFKACPFCVKVRRYMRRHSLNIELKDAKNDTVIKDELIREGGKHKVPCLRIDMDGNSTKWLYSSDDICSFLDAELNRLQ